MRTIVMSRSPWLAKHLDCHLYGCQASIEGVNQVDTVGGYDTYISDGMPPISSGASIIGWSHLSDKLNSDVVYADTLLEGQGLAVNTSNTKGIEVGLAGWHDKLEGWQGKPFIVAEQMHLMNRDLGPRLGEPAGLTIRPIAPDSRLAQEVLTKLDALLVDYTGPVCLRLILAGQKVIVEQLKLGFIEGWFETALELQKGNLLDEPLNLAENIAVGILVTRPPYPYSDPDYVSVKPKLEKAAERHVHWQHLQNGSLFYATAWGEPLKAELLAKEARMRIYRSLRNMQIPEVQYRTDISSLAHITFGEVESLGLLAPLVSHSGCDSTVSFAP